MPSSQTGEAFSRVAIWDGSITDCVQQNHLIRVRCGLNCTPHYLASFLNSAAGRHVLIGRGKTTSGLNTINVSNVKQAEIPLPPIFPRCKFSLFANITNRLIARHITEAARADAMAASLNARLLA